MAERGGFTSLVGDGLCLGAGFGKSGSPLQVTKFHTENEDKTQLTVSHICLYYFIKYFC